MTVHNHPPYRPACNERLVDGELRGACLEDDGTGKATSTSTVVEHRITWYVWSRSGERMRHSASMRGAWGWDAECSCGWGSQTGGATRGSVNRDVRAHKIDAYWRSC